MPPHTCPLNQIATNKCEASTCMWYSSKAAMGCFHGLIRRDSVTRVDLAQYKPEVPGFTQAKERIQMALVLDRYVSSSAQVRGSTPVPAVLRGLCNGSPLFRQDLFPGLTLEALKHLCLIKTFELFASQLSVPATLPEVLFLDQTQIAFILSYQEQPL